MSKYVRTKNGIYNLEEKDENWQKCYQINDEFEEETYGGKTGRTLYIPSKKVLKQADSIEELVDIYVVDSKTNAFKNKILHKWNGHHIVIDWSTNMTYELEDLPDYFTNIRCGIFTDKGIIYAGDMNNEGDLEVYE